MTYRAARLALALPLALALVSLGSGGCDSGNDDETDTDTHGEADCAAEDRDDEFMVGLAKSGTAATVTFVSADPAPPAMGDNTWLVSVRDLGGQPLESATIATVVPFMPDHGHGTGVNAIATATETPGEFEITPVNLYMAGYWTITLALELEGGTTDEVVFGFCVE